MNQTNSIQGYWYTVLVWVAVMAVCLSISARAAEFRQASVKQFPPLPTSRHFHAASQREDCSVYSAVISRVRRELTHKKEILKEITGTALERRAELEKCALSKGLTSLLQEIDEDDEVYLAQVCSEQYDLWLSPGYHVEMVRGEVEELNADLEVAMNHVQLKCPRQTLNEFR